MDSSIQDEFISTVSHELRTPLTSIRGFSQTILNSWDKINDDDKKKFIKIIEEQSNRLIHLVENILSVSKLENDNQVLKSVDVNKQIKNVVLLLQAKYKNRKFITNFSEKLPFGMLDEDKFEQIMTNLIDNAAKYSEKEIIISTKIFNNNILISVQDYGIGIKESDYSKLFQKFGRLENHLTGKTQGNGLGLYITKQLVEKMHGKIRFQSVFNEGTTFEIEFPFYNEEVALKCSQQP